MSIRSESINGSMSGVGEAVVAELSQPQLVGIYILCCTLLMIVIVTVIKCFITEHNSAQPEMPDLQNNRRDSNESTYYSSASCVDRASDIEFIIDLPSPQLSI